MKKLLILTSGLLLTAAAHSNAQHLSLGPVASLGHSWTSGISGNRDFKFAPALGVGLVYSRHENIGWGGELTISHEGFKSEYLLANGMVQDVTVNPVYLRMPLHLIYFFGQRGDKVRPKIYAGPTLGLRIDERRKYSTGTTTILENSSSLTGDLFSRGDFGLNAGIGANFKVTLNAWLNLDAGYYHGLVDVIPTDMDNNHNRNIRLNVGLMFGL